ncbi:methionine--tRNA ligase [Candidatus Woesearchaeota archaeon]|nr:methionine--tRNA ligase [Candidatus Woesearchaeota archaeon]HIH37371.1 methionine--tRNA ligase [Candidatus Woesearchaeota archaeon]HIJ03604.1 methionine--tRNA ligase [Candidatus Woesearchaeota archaeon]
MKKTGKNKFYVTTPIYYVNDVPHIGHAYTTIAADMISRWHKLKGERVFFLTGTDEHGQKVENTAKAKGMEPKAFCDALAPKFKEVWEKLGASYDHFIRTTDPSHEEAVKKLILSVKDDIYKGEYEDYYCVPCETYWTEIQAPEHVCPDCKRPLQKLKEETYYFKLSEYEKPLLDYYKKNPDFVLPKTRMNEIVSRVKGGLKDLSITRTSFSWGIPFPLDEKHITYVWFDALANYITAIGAYQDEKTFDSWWPADFHIVGKDILWFHAVIWPAMLLAAKREPPKHVFAHGWWTVEGEKMSKSKGNFISPLTEIETFGADAFRYFLLREITFGEDGDYSKKAFISRLNGELADDLGNLVQRCAVMIEKRCNGKIPPQGPMKQVDKGLVAAAEGVFHEADKQLAELAFSRALDTIWEFIREVNKYMNDTEPWRETSEERIGTILYHVAESLRFISILINPIMPGASAHIREQFGFADEGSDKLKFGLLGPGFSIIKKDILFVKKEAERNDPFSRVQLKVARIMSAREHPEAEKLLILSIEIGEEKRQLVAGLKGHYTPEELAGKHIIVVANLKPAKLRGEVSQGMLLAGDDGKDVGLVTSTADHGTIVNAEGITYDGTDKITIDEFLKNKLLVKEGKAFYGDLALNTSSEKNLFVEKIKEGKIR